MASEKTETKKKTKRKGNPKWVKGVSQNPAGRPRLTPEQKALRLKSRTHVKNLLHQYSSLTIAEIDRHLREKKLPIIDMALLKHLKKTYTAGDNSGVDWHLDHMFGKVREEKTLRLEGNLDTGPTNLKKLSDEELETLEKLAAKAEEPEK